MKGLISLVQEKGFTVFTDLNGHKYIIIDNKKQYISGPNSIWLSID